ncbi:hypothetical protein CDCA_CDCA19G4734 [Cyanidium caldarium]|uniref:Uncharacterized protein n=1 Tax=Cyanidium caldarium TaxID=2771 RepID=A0AAV9J2K1_CYACA|nr:hypothetical protein CDCA_CDCA19G4734 [Cyanidium caldarium]
MEESLDENALLADWLRALGPLPPGAASRVLWVDADWWLAWQEAWRPQLEPHLRTRLQVASVHCVSDGDADVEDRAGWCWDAARQQVVLVARTFHESVVLQVAAYLRAHGLATPSTSSPPTLLQASPAVHRLVNVPHPCAACWRVLQRAGLGDHFAAPPSSLPLRWRRDALGIDTLCWPSAVRECRLHGRQEWTAQAIAETLMRDPRWRWERVRYVGSWATAVARHMERMRRQRPRRSAMAAAAAAESSSQVNDTLDWRCIGRAEESAAVAPDRAFPVDDPGTARVPLPRRCARRKCARLVLIDRMLDPITPLLTQMTYAGLWSEVARAAYPSWTALGLSPRAIAADDPLLLRIADRNFSEAVRELGHAANRLKRFSEARPNRQTADLQQIAVYVQGLEAHQTEHATVSRHLEAATCMSERTFERVAFRQRFELERQMLHGVTALRSRRTWLEQRLVDVIAMAAEVPDRLAYWRLACLQALCAGGDAAYWRDPVRLQAALVFGVETVVADVLALQQAGLLPAAAAPWKGPRMAETFDWALARDALGLLHPYEGEGTGGEYAGYTPITVALARLAWDAPPPPSPPPLTPPKTREPEGSERITPASTFWRELQPTSSLLLSQAPALLKRAQPRHWEQRALTDLCHQALRCAEPPGTLEWDKDEDGGETVEYVVILGGVTLAEAAALRASPEYEQHQRIVQVASTAVVNDSEWLEQWMTG